MSYTLKSKKSPRLKQLQKLNGTTHKLEVGVFDSELARIGSYHEFGTSNIPRRSFIRAWFDMNSRALGMRMSKAAKEIAQGNSEKVALGKVGAWAVVGIKVRIIAKIPPKLAPSTIARKSGKYKTTPLIDRGNLFRAIEYKVVKK